MPVNANSYKKACIYKIWSLMTDKIYIGSTCDMIKRWSNHKSDYKRWKNDNGSNNCRSFDLFELVGFDNCQIELVKNFPCNSKAELNREEGSVMREFKDVLINTRIAGRIKKEYKIDNKEVIAEKSKEYYEDNKQIILEKQKEYYQDNKQQIAEKNKIKYTCECGSISTICNKSHHEKTKKHQTFITTQ